MIILTHKRGDKVITFCNVLSWYLKAWEEPIIIQFLNGVHIKYGLGKFSCVPYGREQRNKYCVTYRNVITALKCLVIS